MNVNEKISHRVGTKTLSLKNKNNSPFSDSEVLVTQKRHKFLFGCSEFTALPYANGELEGREAEIAKERYERLYDIFNYVTLPFYLARFEPERGRPDTDRMSKAVDMYRKNGIRLKGHPLCWHTLSPDWLNALPLTEVNAELLSRISRDAGGFKGRVDVWDVINEAVIMPDFDKDINAVTNLCKEKGRVPLIQELFAAAKEANPEATLLINDFNTSEKYAELIERLLDKDVPIDVIGIQSHMHQGYWGVEKTLEVLERFARFGLPLHFTETTLVSGNLMPREICDLNDYKNTEWLSTPDGLERQAREATEFYKTLFEHPLVESITWWSFNDGLWLGAPSGLITKESKPKPVYEELIRLIKGDWWSGERKLLTDSDGNLTVTGFYGDYTAEFDGRVIEFSI